MSYISYSMKRVAIIFFVILFALLPEGNVEASSIEQGENKIYDSLNDKVKNHFYEGLESVEEAEETPIDISGNLAERMLRTIADILYKNLQEIKAASLLAGTVSFLCGFVIYKTVKLNKGMKRYALSVFMITIPLALFIFVIASSLFIDIYI